MQKLTVLVENTAGKNRTQAEHGLCYLLETDEKKFLLDTGQGMVLKNNLDRIGINLNTIDSIILSHGHYDHTGGLAVAQAGMNNFRVYAHPQAAEKKFARNADGSARSVGMTDASRQLMDEQADWIPVEGPMDMGGGLHLTGPIPRLTDFENTGGAFFLDTACTQIDLIPDDQSVFFETAKGTVVILGCAHAGVINILKHIQTLTNHRPIHTLIGGMHLINASEERINRTVDALRELNIQRIFPLHCTGFAAAARLWNEFPGQCTTAPVGTVLEF